VSGGRIAGSQGTPERAVRERFAASVRRERAARGWTQKETASRAGLHKATIANIEKGRYGATLDAASLLAGAFGVTIGALADARDAS
jgi:transcriptional regulator with XRE-family HTH domain